MHSHFQILLRFEGVLGVVRKSRGVSFHVLLHFYDYISLKSFEGLRELPPLSPPAPCVHLWVIVTIVVNTVMVEKF